MTRKFSSALEIVLEAVILGSSLYFLYMFFWLLGQILGVC